MGLSAAWQDKPIFNFGQSTQLPLKRQNHIKGRENDIRKAVFSRIDLQCVA
jgi:hypothetical protein